jgi:hypothetical protein
MAGQGQLAGLDPEEFERRFRGVPPPRRSENIEDRRAEGVPDLYGTGAIFDPHLYLPSGTYFTDELDPQPKTPTPLARALGINSIKADPLRSLINLLGQERAKRPGS